MKSVNCLRVKCLVLILIFLFICLSCNRRKEVIYREERGKIFNTLYVVKYKYYRSLKNEVETRLNEFDNSLNPFKKNSIISKVNNNEEVIVDSLFVNVFNRATEISTLSDGLFDITLSPLINAWGFGFENMDSINDVVIDSLKHFVGYTKASIEEGQVAKTDTRVNLNMSAIAKGYSTDVIAALLESYGITDYMVEIGGEIRTKGLNSKGKCWQIALSQPQYLNSYVQQDTSLILQLCNKSIATSGSYYKYYIKDGKKYAHTIDPRTGYPVNNNILSATVIADDCMTADAFATVFMLTDTAETRRLAIQENIAYMLILSTGNEIYQSVQSSDFSEFIAKNR